MSIKFSYLILHIIFLNYLNIFCQNESYSQFGQDEFVAKLLNNKKNGIFIDIGASDGIVGSNTYYFEKHLGWKGLCIEPRENMFKILSKVRKTTCIKGCIYKTNGEKEFLIMTGPESALSGLVETYDKDHMATLNMHLHHTGSQKQKIKVKTYNLNDLCRKHKISKVDYLSIDTEGSEEEIIKSIDFKKLAIDIISVENNYNNQRLRDYLKSKNYKFIHRLGVDDVFRKMN